MLYLQQFQGMILCIRRNFSRVFKKIHVYIYTIIFNFITLRQYKRIINHGDFMKEYFTIKVKLSSKYALYKMHRSDALA